MSQTPNRVGNIPMHWYDDLPHVGYDINGKKVLRPARGDELDKFLETVEDPSSWYVVLQKLSAFGLTEPRLGPLPSTRKPRWINLSHQRNLT